jgi:hypothetical protein
VQIYVVIVYYITKILRISAEFTPSLDIKEEEIIAGHKPTKAKRTIISGKNITNEAHKERLKEMSRNDLCQLFRT